MTDRPRFSYVREQINEDLYPRERRFYEYLSFWLALGAWIALVWLTADGIASLWETAI